ncbi:hypothetical protein CA11_33220 [Gimesia maris]|nr:hypothetical protein CA11_33220 [Gimesia maris]
MSTLSPSFVCDTLQAPSNPDLQPIQSQQTGQPPELAEWPVFMCHIPSDWEPKSGSALPPNAKRFKSGRMAVEVAAILNREILNQSTGGTVQSWYIRISKRSNKQGVIRVSIPGYLDWKPSSEYDMPESQLTIKGKLSAVRGEVSKMNQSLSDDKYKEHRFYIGFALDRVPDKNDPKQPETVEADPVETQERKPEVQKPVKQSSNAGGAWVYLIDVPCDYNHFSWKSLPKTDDFQRRKNGRLAMIEALQANQRIYDRAKARPVHVWYVVVKVSGGYGIVQIKGEFCPRDAYDMPQPFFTTSQSIKRVKELNTILDRGTYTKGRKRAYVAIQFDRNINFRESRVDQPDAKPEPQAVPQTAPAEKPIPPFPGPDWKEFIPKDSNSISVSGVRYVSEDSQSLTAVDLLKRHGLEIHQVNVDQRDERLKQLFGEIR